MISNLNIPAVRKVYRLSHAENYNRGSVTARCASVCVRDVCARCCSTLGVPSSQQDDNSPPLIIGLICFHSAALTARGSCYSAEAHGDSATCAHTCVHACTQETKKESWSHSVLLPRYWCCCSFLISVDNKHFHFFIFCKLDIITCY